MQMKLNKLRTQIKKGGNVFVFVPVSAATGEIGGSYAQVVKTTLLEGLEHMPDSTMYDVKLDGGCVFIGKPRVPATTS